MANDYAEVVALLKGVVVGPNYIILSHFLFSDDVLFNGIGKIYITWY